jgi:hypothetical protein
MTPLSAAQISNFITTLGAEQGATFVASGNVAEAYGNTITGEQVETLFRTIGYSQEDTVSFSSLAQISTDKLFALFDTNNDLGINADEINAFSARDAQGVLDALKDSAPAVEAAQAPETTVLRFEEDKYLEANPDVAAAVKAGTFASGLAHYKAVGVLEGRSLRNGAARSVFNEAFYLAANPDLDAAIKMGLYKGSARDHLITHGLAEGRALSTEAANADIGTPVQQAAIDVGSLETFRSGLKGSSIFDEKGFDSVYYLQQNPQAANSGLSPFKHFVTIGVNEGFSPNAAHRAAVATVDPENSPTENTNLKFDANRYLAAHPDVAKAVAQGLTTAFNHFVRFGIFENRRGFSQGT